jgi:enamine deaminase RidA (YjgF/YER057c/UK114 family)
MVEELRKRLAPEVKPALTIVLTPLPHREAFVAIDAVAAVNQSAGRVETVQLVNSDALAGDATCADFAVLPAGGVAYLSGQPEKGSLAASAVMESLSKLVRTLGQLDLAPADIVQVKVFLTPATSAADALEEVKRLFPDQLTPPVVFVEWIASVPVEIELVAQLHDQGQASRGLEFYDPPEVRPSTVFSRVALVRADRQVFISGLSAREEGDGESQVRDVFAQLQKILGETQSSMKHLAKATYFVSDDDASRMLTQLRPEYLAPTHPPAASKVTVHGVGQPNRSLTIDFIAVGDDD